MNIRHAMVGVAVVAMAPLLASAEKYIEISRGDIANDVTLLDVDSPKVNPATKGVEFKYRTISDATLGSGKTVIEWTAVTWCRQMSMWDLRADSVYSGYKVPVQEFYPVVVVTNFGDRFGKLVAAACDVGQPKEIDELMRPLPGADCLNPKDAFSKAACSTNSEMRGNMALLLRRIETIGAMCGNAVQLKGALAAASEGTKYCYGRDKCIRQQLGALISAVNADARELEKWEFSRSPQPFPIGKVCTAESQLKKWEQEKKERKAQLEAVSETTDEFFGCARKHVAKLDDRRSDAAVIAKVVYRPCSKEFYRALEARDGKSDAEELKKSFEDQLLEMVLMNRAGAGKGR
jgi:hypothetical protein